MNQNRLFRNALRKLNVIADGQDINGDQFDRVSSPWLSLYAELDRKDRAPFSPENVPDVFGDTLAHMLAYRCADNFYVDPGRKAELYAEAMDPRRMDSAYRRYLDLLNTGDDDDDGATDLAVQYY